MKEIIDCLKFYGFTREVKSVNQIYREDKSAINKQIIYIMFNNFNPAIRNNAKAMYQGKVPSYIMNTTVNSCFKTLLDKQGNLKPIVLQAVYYYFSIP